MREMLAGVRTSKAFVKVPLMPPSVTLLTGADESERPYGDLIRYGQGKVGATVMNVSVCAGFYLTDSVKSGMSVVVTTRGDPGAARKLAAELAGRAWAERNRYVPHLVPIAEAVRRMIEVERDPSLPALCFADVADNPGGGGTGQHHRPAAGVRRGESAPRGAGDVQRSGSACARRIAAERGAFRAAFNREETTALEALRGRRRGDAALGRQPRRPARRQPGPHAHAGPERARAHRRRGGIDVIVISIRQQMTDPAILEHFGIDVARLRGSS
jgi:microcystin degradation protein MlrC